MIDVLALNRLSRWFWTVSLVSAPVFSPVPLICGPDAVIVSGERIGKVIQAGSTLNNRSRRSIFLLLREGRILRVQPGGRLKIPRTGQSRSAVFEEAGKSLADYHRSVKRLNSAISRKFRGLVLPDTVEGDLVYPVGACLLEAPEAFKWEWEVPPLVRFEIYPASGNIPLVSLEVQDSLLARGSFEGLLKPGRSYRWRVERQGKVSASRFSLLAESQLEPLNDALQTLAAAEAADSAAAANEYGWLMLRLAALCERSLFYEARALLHQQTGQPGSWPEELRELLVQVRRLQRYGYLIGKP